MKPQANTIVFIGFKHVGKSLIARKVAEQLQVDFIDLDQIIENRMGSSCRDIMQAQGQTYFRNLEKNILAEILQSKPPLLSLGGGTPMDVDNQALIKEQIVIHIKADRDVVFERIMKTGQPVFFSNEKNPQDSFNQLWDEREKIYLNLASFSVDNSGSVESAVEQVLHYLSTHCNKGSL